MSVVRETTPEEEADWASRTPEPIDLELPGWTRTVTSGSLPNERYVQLVRGASVIVLTRYWDSPLHPGGAMTIASTRPTTLAGEPAEVVRTEFFQGRRDEVDVVYTSGPRWTARIVFRGCTPDVVDAACAAVRLVTA